MGVVAIHTGTDARAPKALTVTELARLLRDTLESNPLLTRVLVRGELSDVSRTPNGHWFFTLRDAGAQIPCALFREAAEDLGFALEDGMEVLASGDVELYARRGEVQLVVRALTPVGVGAFWVTFQRTRRKLEAEGLFDPARKRPLPTFPRRIGVVTSEAGAVLHDIVTILRRRFPLAGVVLSPAIVQGPDAPASLRDALVRIQNRVDLVIVARGGGSLEDLEAFNDEALARAIAACPVPVVSAVGHETDVTIADFVADVRAATPSAAAELTSPDAEDLSAEIIAFREALVGSLGSALRERRTGLGTASRRLSPQALLREIRSARERIARDGTDLLDVAHRQLKERQDGLASVAARLDAVSPFATLRRGYAIVEHEDGRPVTRAQEASVGRPLIVRLRDGRLHVHVDSKEENS
jgi:exodeoxyribonuclease VII large subunit